MARPFFDTNVLIYAISDDPRGDQAGAELLLTEDMQDSLTVDGRLTLRNPFKIA